MHAAEWFSAKSVFRHHRVEASVSKTVFEERVVLVHAASFEDALARAEAEAAEYCAMAGGPVDYLGFVDVHRLASAQVGHGTEVYSSMRESVLDPSEYLDRFYDDGHERRQHFTQST